MRKEVIHLALPWDITTDTLELDPSSRAADRYTWQHAFSYLLAKENDDAYERFTDAEVADIIIGAAALLQVEAGTAGQCLDTALVWSRG